MNEDRLRHNLARRADGPAPDLLPAIQSAISTQPQGLSSTPLPAFAGLVATIAVVLAVAVAIPRIAPQATASPNAAGVATPAEAGTSTEATTPRLASPAAHIACPPVYEPLGDVAPTVRDVTGLVESCAAASPDGKEGGAVRNPDGELSALEIEWSGSSCDAAAILSLSYSDQGYRLEIAPVGTECRLLRGAYAIRLALRGEIPEDEVQIVHGAPLEAATGPGWWELAAHERPTAESTELDVVVFERACAGGHSPLGRIEGPQIEYDEGVVSITFSVRSLPGEGDCPLAPGVPWTVQLAEPLGDRRINDGGFNSVDVVIESSEELLAISSSRVDQLAHERFEAMLGGQGCTTTIDPDSHVPTQEELEAAASELGGEDGFVAFGVYLTSNWLRAARAFGAIEAYAGRPKPWYIVRSVDDSLVLETLDPFPISGGRTIWYAGLQTVTSADPGCGAASPTPRPSSDPPTVKD